MTLQTAPGPSGLTRSASGGRPRSAPGSGRRHGPGPVSGADGAGGHPGPAGRRTGRRVRVVVLRPAEHRRGDGRVTAAGARVGAVPGHRAARSRPGHPGGNPEAAASGRDRGDHLQGAGRPAAGGSDRRHRRDPLSAAGLRQYRGAGRLHDHRQHLRHRRRPASPPDRSAARGRGDPRQIRRALLVEAPRRCARGPSGLALGIAIAAVGTAISGSLSAGLAVRPLPLALAALAGVAVTLVSALAPARRAMVVSPLDALRPVADVTTARRSGLVRSVVGGTLGLLGAATWSRPSAPRRQRYLGPQRGRLGVARRQP